MFIAYPFGYFSSWQLIVEKLIPAVKNQTQGFTYAFTPSFDTVFTDSGDLIISTTGGTLEYDDLNDNTRQIPIVAGTHYPIKVKQIRSTNTTVAASDLAVFVR